MTSQGDSKTPHTRLADRLAAARHGRFIGRESELEQFRTALLADQSPFAILHIYGPGGVGKTTLLREYHRIAQSMQRTAVFIDSRNLEVSPAGFQRALYLALSGRPTPAPIPEDLILLIDTYELLSPLDYWLRQDFLPQLPPDVIVIFAGRRPPDSAWHTEPGWSELTRTIPLRNLRPEESQTFLTVRGVPSENHAQVLAFTHGHPLALSLVADILIQEDKTSSLNFQTEPDIVRVLLERFTSNVPDVQHRQALEICAHVRVTTEALLAHFLGKEAAYALFAWLAELSFIQQSGQGLFPHDLAREVLDADFHWRNPQAYQIMHRTARLFYEAQIREGAPQTTSADLLYLLRYFAALNPYFNWSILGQAYMEPATTADHPFILEKTKQYEGEESAEIVRYWLQKQPQGFTMFRTAQENQLGFIHVLMLSEITEADARADPALSVFRSYIEEHMALRPSDLINIVRFWMGNEVYQTVELQTLVALSSTITWFSTRQMVWTFACTAWPQDWQGMFDRFHFEYTGEADFTIGGHRYGVFTHNWRKEPVSEWYNLLEAQFLLYGAKKEQPSTSPAYLTLSQPEFIEAVRQALRDYTRPDLLANNPLMQSSLVVETADTAPTPDTLQKLLLDAANSLTTNPKDAKFHAAVHHTYLKPAPSQEAAAELLDLPLGTYRYRLAKGVEHIANWLWQQELNNQLR